MTGGDWPSAGQLVETPALLLIRTGAETAVAVDKCGKGGHWRWRIHFSCAPPVTSVRRSSCASHAQQWNFDRRRCAVAGTIAAGVWP